MSKKNLAIIIIAVVLIIVGTIFLRNRGNDNSKNTQTTQVVESPIAKKKTNGTFDVYNTDITTNTGSTKISATIENISGKETKEQMVEIVLLDKNNNELGTIKVSVPSLKAGVATELSAETLTVYNDIYDFKIK